MRSPCWERSRPLFSLHDETLFELCRGRPLSDSVIDPGEIDFADPERARGVRFACETLKVLRRRKEELPVAELLELAIELTGFDAVLMSEFLGERKLANLEKLIEQAHASDRAGGDLASFRKQLAMFANTRRRKASPTSSHSENLSGSLRSTPPRGLSSPSLCLRISTGRRTRGIPTRGITTD